METESRAYTPSPNPRPRTWLRVGLIGALVWAATFLPPETQVGACKPGAVEVAPGDLEADGAGPNAPELVSVVLVKPANQVGLSCSEPCVEDLGIEFTLRTSATRVYVSGAGRAYFIDRAENTPDESARFYLDPGVFPGGPPSSFNVAVVGDDGRISVPLSVPYERDQIPEGR